MSPRTFLLLVATLATGPLQFAAAQPPADPAWTFSMQWENDSTNPHSDRYYTNGLRIGLTSPTDQVPGFLSRIGHSLLGDGRQRYALELEQLIFTPAGIDAPRPNPRDRPYAGILMGTVSLIQDTETRRSVLNLGLGLIGPAALAEQAQTGWHHLTGNSPPRGWGSQIPNQPVIQLTAERTWRTAPLPVGGLQLDALPAVTIGAGTFRIYGQAGGQVRLGQGLDADFGAPRVRPGLTGTDAYIQTRPFVWYLFAGIDGQVVGWDETLDGLPFGASHHVSRVPLVGELQAGFAMMVHGVRITVMEIAQTQEFSGQRGGLFLFTSAALAFKF
jgi:lipid A 3-O-deacylase